MRGWITACPETTSPRFSSTTGRISRMKHRADKLFYRPDIEIGISVKRDEIADAGKEFPISAKNADAVGLPAAQEAAELPSTPPRLRCPADVFVLA